MKDTVSDSDEVLMQRFCRGDAAAFEQLYGRHKGGVFRYFLRQCGNAALAEEMHQDVWLKVVDMAGRYRPTARFQTLLYTMAHNRLVDHYRRSANALPVSYAANASDAANNLPGLPGDEPERRLSGERDMALLLTALADLPEAQRETFLLRHEAGLSIEEIATATGTSRETAKSRLRYAMNTLRRRMNEALT